MTTGFTAGGTPLSKNLPLELAHCVEAALDKKAEDLVVLDLRGLSDVTDFFVICHGTSDRQVVAIADNIEERLRPELRVKPAHVEGRRRAEWVLMDYIDFVVHVFLAEKREFYRLERLWGDAPRVETGSARAARRPGIDGTQDLIRLSPVRIRVLVGRQASGRRGRRPARPLRRAHPQARRGLRDRLGPGGQGRRSVQRRARPGARRAPARGQADRPRDRSIALDRTGRSVLERSAVGASAGAGPLRAPTS